MIIDVDFSFSKFSMIFVFSTLSNFRKFFMFSVSLFVCVSVLMDCYEVFFNSAAAAAISATISKPLWSSKGLCSPCHFYQVQGL